MAGIGDTDIGDMYIVRDIYEYMPPIPVPPIPVKTAVIGDAGKIN